MVLASSVVQHGASTLLIVIVVAALVVAGLVILGFFLGLIGRSLLNGVCAGLGGQGFGLSLGISGTAADFPSNAATKPTFTIVTRIDKSVVKAKPQPNGPNNFDICLGAVNTLTGLTNTNACVNANTDPSFPAKGGGCAVRATSSDGTDAYWAVLPDGPNGAKSCIDSRIKFPVVLSKTKNGAGDVILTTCVPYPRDPHPINGP